MQRHSVRCPAQQGSIRHGPSSMHHWRAPCARARTSSSGSFVLYSIEHACSMLLMNVCGLVQRGVSTTYATTVGKEEAKSSVMMEPEADHVKISIWPGVSTMMCCRGGSRGFSQSSMTCRGVVMVVMVVMVVVVVVVVVVVAQQPGVQCKQAVSDEVPAGAAACAADCWGGGQGMERKRCGVVARCCLGISAGGSVGGAGSCVCAVCACMSIGSHALTWSKRVAKRLHDVRMPPLGPRLYCFMTFLYLTCTGRRGMADHSVRGHS
jgi:hypothetical protein